jgi:hypothetical protein
MDIEDSLYIFLFDLEHLLGLVMGNVELLHLSCTGYATVIKNTSFRLHPFWRSSRYCP